MNRNELLVKINEIIIILFNEPNVEEEMSILPVKEKTTNYNRFSQAEIEKIIRVENLEDEIIKF